MRKTEAYCIEGRNFSPGPFASETVCSTYSESKDGEGDGGKGGGIGGKMGEAEFSGIGKCIGLNKVGEGGESSLMVGITSIEKREGGFGRVLSCIASFLEIGAA